MFGNNNSYYFNAYTTECCSLMFLVFSFVISCMIINGIISSLYMVCAHMNNIVIEFRLLATRFFKVFRCKGKDGHFLSFQALTQLIIIIYLRSFVLYQILNLILKDYM